MLPFKHLMKVHWIICSTDFRLRCFAHKINMAQDLWNKTMELEKLREEHLERQEYMMTIFENLKGSSEGLFSVMEQIKDIADVPFSTLIYGESGVGKELVARALHDTSSRRNEPFWRSTAQQFISLKYLNLNSLDMKRVHLQEHNLKEKGFVQVLVTELCF